MVRWTADSVGPRWTANRGRGGASPPRGHWSSPVTDVEDEPVKAVLGSCSPVMEEWQ
jgi:hypothetical protein